MDALFVNPDSSKQAYQGLADVYSAIEPPTWALLLAESCRSKGFGVGILDCGAERLTLDQAVGRVGDADPRLVVLVVYGQNPNSGTVNMSGAMAFAQALKSAYPEYPICFVGSYTSALPREVLSHDCVDLVLLNEGVYALHNLLRSNLGSDLPRVKGIGFKRRNRRGDPDLFLNVPETVVPQERMDVDLPGYAWDLLPYRKRPLDLYRAHVWHAEFEQEARTPFAAIYTSLGCRFACDFCMVNILNRTENGDRVNASHSRGMRFWSPSWVLRELEKLAGMGVRLVRLSDEMFFLDKRHYLPILDKVVEEDLGVKMWAYARVDTVREAYLERFRKAGIGWLALGIEAGNQVVRHKMSKGSFREVNIREVCRVVRAAGLNVISNYIFGLPDDNLDTMQETLDLALELNTEMANMYPCHALPGSPLYHRARANGWELPENYEGYGFLSYESRPLPTKYVSAAQVLKFRDEAWQRYFTNPAYLDLVEKKFGMEQRKFVEEMTRIKLRRKLLEEPVSQ